MIIYLGLCSYYVRNTLDYEIYYMHNNSTSNVTLDSSSTIPLDMTVAYLPSLWTQHFTVHQTSHLTVIDGDQPPKKGGEIRISKEIRNKYRSFIICFILNDRLISTRYCTCHFGLNCIYTIFNIYRIRVSFGYFLE